MKKTMLLSAVGIVMLVAGGWYFYSSDVFSREEKAEIVNTLDILMNADPSTVIARVNGRDITQEKYAKILSDLTTVRGTDIALLDEPAKKALMDEAMDILISQELLNQAVEKSGVTVTEAEIDDRLAQIRSQFESDESFDAALATDGLTQEELRGQVQQGMITDKYLAEELLFDEIEVSDAEIEATYTQVSTTDPNSPPLEEVREQVRNMVLMQKQREKLVTFIDTLRVNATIEILTIKAKVVTKEDAEVAEEDTEIETQGETTEEETE